MDDETKKVLNDTTKRVHGELPKLYQAIGHALDLWQHVEEALNFIFRRVSTCSSEHVASAIYYSPRDFSDKLKMTHNAMRFAINDEKLLQEWAELRKLMINASEVRNALAHFTVVIHTPVEGYEHTRPLLKPNFFDVTEKFKDRKPAVQNLNADTIHEHMLAFHALEIKLREFLPRIPQP